jgi:hypothetical protein
MSEKQWFSQQEIITGPTIDYKRDCKATVGVYAKASIDIEITNQNMEHRQSCIYLGQSRNCQGSIKCFRINTWVVVVRLIFDALPYPEAIIKKVEDWGKHEKRTIFREQIEFVNQKTGIFD